MLTRYLSDLDGFGVVKSSFGDDGSSRFHSVAAFEDRTDLWLSTGIASAPVVSTSALSAPILSEHTAIAAQANVGLGSATLGSASLGAATAAVVLPAAENGEISFISGVDATGHVAAQSFWNQTHPGYGSTSQGAKWGAAAIGSAGGTVTFGFDVASGWSATEKQVFISCLTLWSDVANIKFVLTDNAGAAQIRFVRGHDGGAYEQVTSQSGGTVAVGSTSLHTLNSVIISVDTSQPGFGPIDGQFDTYGGYVWQTIVHETGHALGLGHAGTYNGNYLPTDQFSAYDMRLWSIMSYIDPSDKSVKYASSYPVKDANWGRTAQGYAYEPTTPMGLDILAVQRLYGAPATTTLNGGEVFGFNSNIEDAAGIFFNFAINRHPVVTLYDRGTGNTLDLSGYSLASKVSLVDGTFSSVNGAIENIFIAYGTMIDTAIGGAGKDSLTGNANANKLDGGAGADTMTGGLGNDTFVVDNIADVAIEAAAEGVDLVLSSVSFTLGVNVDNITLTESANINATGNALANLVIGNAGNNVLDGMVGADTLQGGLGNDTYNVDNAGDIITEGDGQGTELVQATASYTLGVYLENITLLGTANISATGNTLNNVLTGNAGANALSGGSGADTMTGGLGNDTYTIDSASDVVVEVAGQGTDTLNSAMTFEIGDLSIEVLTLTGALDISGYGNALANTINGNSGKNLIDGRQGADTMAGGLGNDTYRVDNTADVVSEAAGQGVDLVLTSVTYALGANVDNITLTESTNINGTGNALANLVIGNAGNNVLDGMVGADTLQGGLGNDTYNVDNVGDVITEADGQGTDLVQATASYTLGAYLENITLLGAANISATGNTLNNVLTGNAGANNLSGGSGADTMTGGLGNDTYTIDSVSDVVVEVAGQGTDALNSAITFEIGDVSIEVLTLTGTLDISGYGNALANTINGNSGKNLIDGRQGADIMAGGLGNDTYRVDNTADVVSEAAGQGVDLVLSSVTFTLGVNVDNITLTESASINATGNALGNLVIGNAGNNVLDGMAGVDTLQGGLGDDTYYVDNVGDIITEGEGQGADLVRAAASYILGANIENITLVGTAAINATGNALNNVLLGNTGANSLNGGSGTDTMTGGLGNDTYTVDSGGDVIVENTGEGTDAVNSAISFDIGTLSIEVVTLTGTTDINGYGSALANTINGNSGNNRLDGRQGADVMAGGIGNDTYVIDSTTDQAVEAAGQGTDLVLASVSFTLGVNVENITLTESASINATGNTLANLITGNSGNNVLDGKVGADTMLGGLGDDTYFVDLASDLVTELSGQGTDLVNASVSYVLGATSFVESLVLIGTSAISGTGSEIANTLTGNAAANTLDGGNGDDLLIGGGGNDILIGGSGADIFRFGTLGGKDTISDFHTNQNDWIDIHAISNGVVGGGGVILSQSGSNAIIDLGGGNVITVLNASATEASFLSHIVW